MVSPPRVSVKLAGHQGESSLACLGPVPALEPIKEAGGRLRFDRPDQDLVLLLGQPHLNYLERECENDGSQGNIELGGMMEKQHRQRLLVFFVFPWCSVDTCYDDDGWGYV